MWFLFLLSTRENLSSRRKARKTRAAAIKKYCSLEVNKWFKWNMKCLTIREINKVWPLNAGSLSWWTEAGRLNLTQALQAGARDYIRCRVTVCCGLCTLIGLLDVTVGVTFSDIHFASAKHKPICPYGFRRVNGGSTYMHTAVIINMFA